MTAPIVKPADIAGLVSFHAVTRYAQRVLGVEPIEMTASSRSMAEAHCKAGVMMACCTCSTVRPAAVALGSAMRMRKVITTDFIACFAENGVVATVKEIDSPDRPRNWKLTMRSKREGKREAHKRLRRLRGRRS